MPAQQAGILQRRAQRFLVVFPFQQGQRNSHIAELFAAQAVPDHMLENMGRQQEDFPAGRAGLGKARCRAVDVVIARVQLDGHLVLSQHYSTVRGRSGIRKKRPRALELPLREEEVDVADLAGRRISIILRRLAPLLDDRMQSGISQLLQQFPLHTRIASIRPGERFLHRPENGVDFLRRPLSGRQLRDPLQDQAHHGLTAAQRQQTIPPGRVGHGGQAQFLLPQARTQDGEKCIPIKSGHSPKVGIFRIFVPWNEENSAHILPAADVELLRAGAVLEDAPARV